MSVFARLDGALQDRGDDELFDVTARSAETR
jgi:hypothetical protein